MQREQACLIHQSEPFVTMKTCFVDASAVNKSFTTFSSNALNKSFPDFGMISIFGQRVLGSRPNVNAK